jgi:hypothetical protein
MLAIPEMNSRRPVFVEVSTALLKELPQRGMQIRTLFQPIQVRFLPIKVWQTLPVTATVNT